MDDSLFDKLREMSGNFPERLNILEEQIDVKLQLEYFKFSKKVKDGKIDGLDFDIDDFSGFDSEGLSVDDKKHILVKLAGIDNPKAYRIIEEYQKHAPKELKNWATLALQESKMLLESLLLDENQIFISTGLGGKGNMLRYFVVLIGENIDEFSEFHKKIISSEFEFALKKDGCEFEKIEYQDNYATLLVLIPFEVPFQNVFRSALEECNQYGNFVKPNFLVTNVKSLSINEIKAFVEKNELPDKEDYNSIEFNPIDDDEE
jgi:hypothetical protein